MGGDKDEKLYLNDTDGSLLILKLTDFPARYRISSTFADISAILADLQMPRVEGMYDLRYLSVEDFLRERGYSYPKLAKRYQRYTVQTFGFTIFPRPGMKLPLSPPNPANYKSPPTYWTFLGIAPIQIWRIRVFSCALGKIKTTVYNPFGVFPPGTVYLEERWHPRRGISRLIGGLEKVPNSLIIDLDGLYEDALRILEGRIKRGRPRENTVSKAKKFRRDLKEHYWKLANKKQERPNKTEVAKSMGIARSTFYGYLNKPNVRWPPRK